jgi:hypothetical protein
MAITVDWITKTFFVPQSDLSLVTGTLYELDTETGFRQEINALMASAEGIVFEDSIQHFTEYTVAGVTYARAISLINGYNITFTPDMQWSVRLSGSNNNLFDIEAGVLNQNQVQVIPQNSAGLINTAITVAEVEQIAAEVWATTQAGNQDPGTMGEAQVEGADSAAFADAVWDEPTADHTTAGSFGEWVGQKLLSFVRFIGLK